MEKIDILVNAVRRRLDLMFDGFFEQSPKHKFYADYGYPEQLTFDHFYQTYKRGGIARALIARTIDKTWQDNPFLLNGDETHKETTLERQVRRKFEEVNLWERLAETDEKGEVGAFSGIILRLADGKSFSEPVTEMGSGLNALVELIPVFENQLMVTEWETDEKSPDYGKPLKWSYTEAKVGGESLSNRSIDVHPDRVFIWSRDGRPNGESALQAAYNDIIDFEKIKGAGGEGFWRNAKNAPFFNMDPTTSVDKLARSLGTTTDKVGDKIDELVEDYNKGFDKYLMFKGVKAEQLSVDLPDPEPFAMICLQSATASFRMPLKILTGSQSGERASTEDGGEWNRTIMSRRSKYVKPNLYRFVRHLEKVRVLPTREDWFISWSDLTENTAEQKMKIALDMTTANKNQLGVGEAVFSSDEIRERVGLEPVNNNDGADLDDE